MPPTSSFSWNRLAGLAWDLDNTLIDRDAAFRRFLEVWLRERHASWTALELESALETLMQMDESGASDRQEFCQAAQERYGSGDASGAEFWATIQESLPSYLEPQPKVLALLETLGERYPMALVSNGGSRLQRAKLERAGLLPYFLADRIFISGEAGSAKPHPAIFARAVEALGVPAGQVLFIGDHPVLDLAGAAAAGLRTCLVLRDQPAAAAPQADAHVRHVTELLPLLS